MKDEEILELYFSRDEGAIQSTDQKYGHLLNKVAQNILSRREDAEECVSDTYLAAWNSIPPEKPDRLKIWLLKVVRNLSLDLWRKNHRQKRYKGMEEIFDELSECLPSPYDVDGEVDRNELVTFLNTWLGGLKKNDRILFLRRYWYGESVKDLCVLFETTPAKLSNRLYYLRKKLKKELLKEGISL